MAESTILPFAGESSNILTQGDYLADTQRLIGHQPGIARAALENKVLRQASLLSAALAKFVADHQATDINDDMTVDDLAVAIANALSSGVPTATETTEGKVELADASEVQSGAPVVGHPARAVTPEGLATLTATEGRRGLARFATVAETIGPAGVATLGTKAVTPKGLQAKVSTSTALGLVELATNAEAIAGEAVVDHPALVLTPQNLAAWADSQFSADLSETGWASFPGGLLIQWGRHTSTGDPFIPFPVPFPTAVFSIVAISNSNDDNLGIAVADISTTQFKIDSNNNGRTNFWFAVGH